MNTSGNNKENERKSKPGIWIALSRLFGSSGGSNIPGLGSLGGLFSSKAGILGMVLGGATIAAGVGVIYNMIGPGSNSGYVPGLFQNSYYESLTRDAQAERRGLSGDSGDKASSLDYFKEQAKKENIAGVGDGASADEKSKQEDSGSADAYNTSGADMPASPSGGEEAFMKPSLVKASGFSAAGSGVKLGGGMGMSGGIGSQFQNIYKAPIGASAGQVSALNAAKKGKSSVSGKRSVPAFNRRGAFGQAKFASKTSKNAAYTGTEAGGKSTAEEAFSGETAGAGDVGIGGGAGVTGGAGLGAGNLKVSDPSLNDNQSEPPEPEKKPKDESPWKKMQTIALIAMVVSALLIALTKYLAKTPAYATHAKITGYLAILAASVVIFAGMVMATKYKQKWMGMMYAAIGAALIYAAYKAIQGIEEKVDIKNPVQGQVSGSDVTAKELGLGQGQPGSTTGTSSTGVKFTIPPK